MHTPHSLLDQDRYSKYLGIELVEAASGHAKARMRLTADHLNGFGIAHGGAVFSLADTAFAAACNSHGYGAVALSATISFTRPGKPGLLVADARELSRTDKVSTYQVQVADEAGLVIASFQGVAYHRRKK